MVEGFLTERFQNLQFWLIQYVRSVFNVSSPSLPLVGLVIRLNVLTVLNAIFDEPKIWLFCEKGYSLISFTKLTFFLLMIPNKINLKFKFIEFVIEKFDNFLKYKGNKTME